ncbi:MAG: ATP-binding protein [Elusimicrobia bacterium]|nr:ATP-binding protein [Elusimicrobiota bacterium]
MPEIIIDMPANFKYVPGVRVLVARVSQAFGFNDQEACQIETIVDELCNNAIEHGSREESQMVRINCKIENEDLEIVVIDSGTRKSFDLEKTIAGKLKLMEQEEQEGRVGERRGRGLVIVKKMSDHLSVDLSDQKTAIRVRKRKAGSL